MRSMSLAGLILALGVLLAGMGYAMVSAQAQTPLLQGIPGTVVSYDGSALTLARQVVQVGESATVTLRVTQTTQVLGTLSVGARVVALAQQAGEQWDAIYVVVTPAAPQAPPATGLVIGVETGVLRVLLPNGAIRTFQMPAGVTAPPLGELVTVFARVRAGSPANAPPEVTGVQTALQTRTRLEQQLQDLTGTGSNLPPAALQNRTQLLERLATRLEEYSRLQLQLLQQQCDRVCQDPAYPLQTRDRLREHLQRMTSDQDRIRDQVQQARNASAGLGPAPTPAPQPTGTPGGPGNGQPSGGGAGGSGGPGGGPP